MDPTLFPLAVHSSFFFFIIIIFFCTIQKMEPIPDQKV